MAIPTKDTALVSFGTNFSTRITAAPADFGLLAADATQYATLLDSYVTAYNALAEARDSGTRSKSLTSARDAVKKSFLSYARYLYDRVQANPNVSDANKNLLGITIRALPSPQPIPAFAPAVDVLSVDGRTVAMRLHDSQDASRRGKPAGVDGAAVFSFVGAEPPASLSDWTFEANVTRTLVEVVFPNSLAAGTQVWLTAFWFNERKQNGPGSTPVSTTLQFGGTMTQAA